MTTAGLGLSFVIVAYGFCELDSKSIDVFLHSHYASYDSVYP